MLCTAGCGNFRGSILHAAVFPEPQADAFFQFLRPGSRGIAGLIINNGADSSQLNGIGRVEIRLAYAKTQRVLSFRLHLFIQIVNRQRT